MVPQFLLTLALAVALDSATPRGLAQGESQSEAASRIRASTSVFAEIMNAPDGGVPKSILDKAEGIAVFPSVLKGGFVIGGLYGHGILSVRDRASQTWSAPAFLSLTGGSFGAQIGGQAVDLVLVIMNRRGLDQLVRNQFKIGVDAAAAAGPVGRNAEASTDIQLRAEILSYSRSRGLFVGVTINGASIRQDRDANMRFYGTAYTTRQIVMERLGGAPEPVAAWRDMLGKYF
jgi:lipid-binding SYLF domain-containing protein